MYNKSIETLTSQQLIVAVTMIISDQAGNCKPKWLFACIYPVHFVKFFIVYLLPMQNLWQ